MKIGAQLYTVRNFTQNLDSFSETLKKIADIGYRSVQVSGTSPYESDWLEEQLKKNGLSCPVTHTDPNRIADQTEEVIRSHQIFGGTVIGIGCAPGSFEGGFQDYEAFRDRFLPAAKQIKDAGLILGYHNHYFEYRKYHGKLLMEYMLSDFGADELSFILDTYWVQYSGGSPSEWIQKLKGRIRCIHFKDLSIVGREQRMAVIGEGNMDFDTIIRACLETGVETALVEQDECYGENPFDCLERSYRNLRAMGLAE